MRRPRVVRVLSTATLTFKIGDGKCQTFELPAMELGAERATTMTNDTEPKAPEQEHFAWIRSRSRCEVFLVYRQKVSSAPNEMEATSDGPKVMPPIFDSTPNDRRGWQLHLMR